MAGGLVYLLVALIVKYAGKDWIEGLSPIVLVLLVMVIGLNLAANAVNDATTLNKSYSIYALLISMVTFLVILFNMYGKKIIGVIPILLGLIVGYIFSAVLGLLTGHSFINFSRGSGGTLDSSSKLDIPFVDYSFKLLSKCDF